MRITVYPARIRYGPHGSRGAVPLSDTGQPKLQTCVENLAYNCIIVIKKFPPPLKNIKILPPAAKHVKKCCMQRSKFKKICLRWLKSSYLRHPIKFVAQGPRILNPGLSISQLHPVKHRINPEPITFLFLSL
jgi:hypothetical protein